jgi:hypothetical protein
MITAIPTVEYSTRSSATSSGYRCPKGGVSEFDQPIRSSFQIHSGPSTFLPFVNCPEINNIDLLIDRCFSIRLEVSFDRTEITRFNDIWGAGTAGKFTVQLLMMFLLHSQSHELTVNERYVASSESCACSCIWDPGIYFRLKTIGAAFPCLAGCMLRLWLQAVSIALQR